MCANPHTLYPIMKTSSANQMLTTTLALSLTLTLFGINATKSLKLCSLFFVTSMAIVRFLLRYNDKKATFAISFMSILVNACILQKISLLTACSLAGLTTSIAVNITTTNLFQPNQRGLRFIISIFFAIVADALVMYVWEYHTFRFEKSLTILTRSLSYKTTTLILLSIAYLLLPYLLKLPSLIKSSLQSYSSKESSSRK